MRVAILLPPGSRFSEAQPNSMETVVRTLAGAAQSSCDDPDVETRIFCCSGADDHNLGGVEALPGGRGRMEALIARLRAFRPDVIEHHQQVKQALAVQQALPEAAHLLYRHNALRAPRHRLDAWRYRARYRRMDGLVFVSRTERDAFVRAFPDMDDRAFAVIRTAGGQAPHPDVDFPELSSTGLLLSSLKPADRALLPEDTPDREVSIDLGGQMMPYEWSILTDGQSSSATVQEGQRLRMVMRNRTMMPHPMHIHGHTWALPGSGGLRKDTVLLRHGETMIADLIADNPGEWAFHCHNAYHMETGMFSSLRYE